ncbi:FtsH protease activity modulator HflK [Allopontixanthobacter sp.]|uniref:FtsH protease activity modulator HflK n=1 Tax=Allopontixanthobacter sp. TaxID=2906452 RepID=UPI002ABB5489|nr:FtsH protease activity modulator HflK [Allopontixanthobacter sp.]MDZ4308321.1 FtsH protease activity modulator HflK [Allopontixanthobacter sp.]
MAGKSPWGGNKGSGASGDGGAGDGDDGKKAGGPRNPWLPSGSDDARRSAKIEDIFKHRGPEGPRRVGGPGGPNFRMPQRPGGKSWLPIIGLVVVAAWLLMSSVHFVQPKEQGIVTTFGKYSRTLQPGTNFTLPWPFQNVDVEQVSTIRSERIPEGGEQKLILTGDQNLVDLSYLIRWNIKDLKQYRFQLAEPDETIREVAEAAMRASVAERTLDETFSGAGRAEIEQRVRTRMQAVLDAYRSGIAVQGVEIAKTDPPAEVNEAFKDVTVAEQDADAAVNTARGTAQQILERAQGETIAFDKVYEEYRQAPEVTRRRLYYETMERVLSQTDKTIVESGGVQTYLPLPEIRQRAQERGQAAAASGQGQ